MRFHRGQRRTYAAPGAVLALALVLAAGVANTPAFSATCAGPLVVTNGQDAYPHPPAGSLRYVLDHAKRDAIITFCDATPVALVAPLDIVSGEDGVSISGGHIGGASSAGGEGLVRVLADGVKLTNDVFTVRLSVSGADDVSLSNDQFSDAGGNPGTSQAVIEVSRALRLTLDHLQVSTTNEQGLGIQGSSEVTVTNSTFTVSHHVAIKVASYPLSSALTISNTTSDGAFELAPVSGEVTGNTISGAGGPGISVAVPNSGHLHHYERLTVSDNTLNDAGLDLERSNVAVNANTVTGGPGIAVSCDPGVADGSVELSANKSSGTAVGFSYSCTSKKVAATSKSNLATSNTVAGFRFNAADLVSTHDSASAGAGTGFGLAAGSGPVTLTADTSTTNAGNGVSTGRGARATISGGTIQNNGKAGVTEGAGAQLHLSHIAMGGNTGPGITGSPVPAPVLKYKGHAIFGTTCANCVVEAFTIEAGARAGNPTNGEGAAFVRQLRADAGGHFVDRVSCAVAVTLTFTATSDGSTPATSGFSEDVSCKPPLFHVFVRVTYAGITCNTVADGSTVTITDPTTSTPVMYYSYFTVPHNCADPSVYAFGDTAWVALNADSEVEKTSDTESSAEDAKELALPDPAFPPDTTVYAGTMEQCSTTNSGLQSNGWTYYMNAPGDPNCNLGMRVDISVVNHQP